MGVLADWQIRDRGFITPFQEAQRTPGLISYGVSSYGYDIRAGTDFLLFDPKNVKDIPGFVIDPKNFDRRLLRSVQADVERVGYCDIPPHAFVLVSSVERLNVPRDILVQVIGKSTYARTSLIVNVTPLEPEWRGHVTIEISNTTDLPVRVYANEGVAQLVFHTADEVCQTSYADKGGRYQDQGPRVTLPTATGGVPVGLDGLPANR